MNRLVWNAFILYSCPTWSDTLLQQKALSLLRNVCTDFDPPTANGYQVLRACRRLSKRKNLKISIA